MHFAWTKSGSYRLFLISFLVLFFELVCIRWLSAYVLYLGYFTNFVLLGALLGIGAGSLLAHKPYTLLKWLPIVLVVFFTIIFFSQAQVSPGYESFIFFTSTVTFLRLPPYVLLPIIFVAVTLIFTALAQIMGRLLSPLLPLYGYTLNILGSLVGIGAFTLMSFLSWPAWVWFLVAMAVMILFLPSGRTTILNIFLLVGVVAIVAYGDYTLHNIWSPYYRLNILPNVEGASPGMPLVKPSGEHYDSYVIFANGVGHQTFESAQNHEDFYDLPYAAFRENPSYQNVLIIGAGGGNDVAEALRRNVQHIDAVEIDPKIIELGKNYHPENPYADPRVSIYVDDARAFLEKTHAQYDLVVFALPDSLVLASTFSSVRLESYLFTEEAFQSVKRHLAPNGLVALYNFYRYQWLVDKLGSTLQKVFGTTPVFHLDSNPNRAIIKFATIFAGPKSTDLELLQAGFTPSNQVSLVPATDDWPFVYLQQPSLPDFYGLSLVLILVFSVVFLLRLAPAGAFSRANWPFFFMGGAFALLETKSIVQLLLLFGSTWVVNGLVFFAILAVVLLANVLAARYTFSRRWILYVLLFVALALNFVFPLRVFLIDNLAVRYILATALLFAPIFLANLIYGATFRHVKTVEMAFGANLLGAMVGGAAEYLALYFGYQDLMILAGLFYVVAFYLLSRRANREVNVAVVGNTAS